MTSRSLLFAASLGLLGGCGLVYSYGDYKDQGPGGATTSATGSSSTSSSGGTTGSTSSTTTSSTSASSTSTSSTSTSSTSTSTSTSSGGGCTSSGTCFVAPDGGWMGPIVLETGPNVPTCTQGEWLTVVSTVQGGTSYESPSGCSTCSCVMSAMCPSSASMNGYDGGTCTGTVTSILETESCSAFTLGAAKGSPTTASGITCAATSVPVPMMQASFDTWAVGCAGPDTLCTGGVCAPPGGPLCVYQMGGNLTCPASFPKPTVVYGKLQSDFACSQCSSCSVSSFPSCVPTVSFYAASGCGGASFATVNLDGQAASCQALGGAAMSAKITNPGTPMGGSCTAAGMGTLSGSATPENPVTVCCTM